MKETLPKPDEQAPESMASRAYRPPRIVAREHLESAAAACTGPGQKEATNGACNDLLDPQS